MKVRVWFDMLTKRDARLLYSWWSSQPCFGWTYEIRKSPSNSMYWALYRLEER